jgi:hypothetical protein
VIRQPILTDLRFQLDIQISPKKMLVVKIYEGDTAADIIGNLKQTKNFNVSEDVMKQIELVVRAHTLS